MAGLCRLAVGVTFFSLNAAMTMRHSIKFITRSDNNIFIVYIAFAFALNYSPSVRETNYAYITLRVQCVRTIHVNFVGAFCTHALA